MTENEQKIYERLARMEEHLRNIDATIARQVACRHITQDGECDFFSIVKDNERKVNQWTGALAAVATICAFIGSLIGIAISRFMK